MRRASHQTSLVQNLQTLSQSAWWKMWRHAPPTLKFWTIPSWRNGQISRKCPALSQKSLSWIKMSPLHQRGRTRIKNYSISSWNQMNVDFKRMQRGIFLRCQFVPGILDRFYAFFRDSWYFLLWRQCHFPCWLQSWCCYFYQKRIVTVAILQIELCLNIFWWRFLVATFIFLLTLTTNTLEFHLLQPLSNE